MRRRRRIVLAAVLTVVVAGVTVGLVAASDPSGGDSAAAAVRGFDPSKLRGKWQGTYTAQGQPPQSIRANVRVRGRGSRKQFTAIVDFGGQNVFGCGDPPAQPYTFRRGRGDNRWNARGFAVDKTTRTAGDIDGKYSFSSKRLSLDGARPRCLEEQNFQGVTWEFDGRLTNTRLTGTAVVRLPNNQSFQVTINVRKL
jgi:hypothetical protein